MKNEPRSRYAIHEDQEFVKDYLQRAARVVLARKDQTPDSILWGAYFLRAVQHLPFIISEHEMVRLEWHQTIQDTRASMSVSFNCEEITMDWDEAFFGPHGSEYNENRVFTVTESGQSGDDNDSLSRYLEDFLQHVEQGTEVYFGAEDSLPQDDMSSDPDPVEWSMAFEMAEED